MPGPQFHTTDEVARRFKRSPRTIRDWISHGCPTGGGLVQLEAARVGRSWLVRDDWLERFEFRVFSRPDRTDLDASDD